MPGLTFIHHSASAHGARAPSPGDSVRDGLQACRYDDRYRIDRLIDTPRRLLASVAYRAYPVACFENRDHWFCLEGRLYGKSDPRIKKELADLSALLFSEGASAQASLRAWLLRTDGPFLLFASEKATGRWAFLNDVLGRLPVYHWQRRNAFFLSRSFPFFVKMEGGPLLDHLGLAQQLMRGFPFGRRTLLQGVRRMQPSTLIRGTAEGDAQSEIISLHTFNFEPRTHRRRPLKENAGRLADLFSAACTRRNASPERNVLALSGGLDSRAVAFAFHKENVSFRRLTFCRHDGSNRRDVEGAQAVARLCEAPGTVLALDPPTGSHCRRLLRAEGGLNLLDVAYTIDFLEKALQHLGAQINCLTGDGGGFILADRRPRRPLGSTNALARYTAGEHWLPPAAAARLTDLSESDLLDSLRERLAAYPETNPAQKYLHFCFYERLFKFSFIGEDRNRCHFWHSAPFYDPAFFNYAMNCPGEQKASFALFRKVLLQLSPHALEVGYANFLGIKMTPLRYRSYTLLRGVARRLPSLKRFLENRLGRQKTLPTGAPLLTCLRHQARCPAVTDALNPDALRRLLDRPERLSRRAWHNLFTLTSLLEWRAGGPQALDAFADTPLT